MRLREFKSRIKSAKLPLRVVVYTEDDILNFTIVDITIAEHTQAVQDFLDMLQEECKSYIEPYYKHYIFNTFEVVVGYAETE